MKYMRFGLMAAVFMAAEGLGSAAASDGVDAPAKKSIVPSKYGNKYKNGGSDELADFINTQCKGKEGFEYTAFFQLCRANGIAEDKVAGYETLVNEKAHGSQGRARMTLRNMLATIARKEGSLVGLDGEEHEINLPKPTLGGAAAAAAAASAAAESKPGEDTNPESKSREDTNSATE